MSATLIAALLALFLGHALAPFTQWRRFGWFGRWLGFLQNRVSNIWGSPFAIFISLGFPMALIVFLHCALDGRAWGIPSFVFSVLVLVYCWGPRNLEADVEAIEEATDLPARDLAVARLAGDDRRVASDDDAGLTVAVFAGARRRWFGVLLWFLILGPFGALLYRLTTCALIEKNVVRLPPAHLTSYQKLLSVLDWPVAHLMALALAVAGNFDAVYGAWREWHLARRGQPFDLSIGFLDAVALASVREYQRDDVTERQEDADEDVLPPQDALATLPAMRAALALAWRALVVWLVLVALLVLAGFV